MNVQPRVLLVTFPAQGHINPALQFAKRLLRIGVHVTLATTDSAIRRMEKTTTPDDGGLSFSPFSDGCEAEFVATANNINHYINKLRGEGSKSLKELIITSKNQGIVYTHIVYSIGIPWVAKVAKEVNIPSTLLWIQAAMTFDIYNCYFNGYDEVIKTKIHENPSFSIKLPALPEFATRDLPTFLCPSNPNTFIIQALKEDFELILDEEKTTKPQVLVNTVDALEPEALKACGKYSLIGVGPLIPSILLNGKDPSNTSSGGDLFKNNSKEYIQWLDRKMVCSVIYVSFGTISNISKPQMEEIAKGLINSGRPFLWVIREIGDGPEENKLLSCREKLEKQGKIVPWCSQVEVLSHPSVGCFLTHCGWNSTLESVCCGVPMVGFPQFADQTTNAKMVEDVWNIGVRVNLNEKGLVEGGEIERCLELVMGDGKRGRDIRSNVKKWKELAVNAAKEGGSPDENLKTFVNETIKGC